jgi:hypothetical protein
MSRSQLVEEQIFGSSLLSFGSRMIAIAYASLSRMNFNFNSSANSANDEAAFNSLLEPSSDLNAFNLCSTSANDGMTRFNVGVLSA